MIRVQGICSEGGGCGSTGVRIVGAGLLAKGLRAKWFASKLAPTFHIRY